MKVTQVSVFLENTAGHLREVTGILAESDINIRALSLADTAQFGILRLIVNRHEEACRVLKDAHYTVRETDVLVVETEDKPGGLQGVLKVFEETGLNVEYMYAFVEKSKDNAALVFRLEHIDRAIEALVSRGYTLLTNRDLQKL